MATDPEQIAGYLRQHPEFFEDYAPLLAEIQLPHPHGGRAISISERQILTLREKVKLLESKLAELIQFGQENDAIGEKLHQLALAFFSAKTLDAALDLTYSRLLEDFAVPHAALRIWHPTGPLQRKEFGEVSADLKAFVAAMSAPVCGTHALYDIRTWFGEDAARLSSFALIPLALSGAPAGLLVLASEDARRFYPEMGVLFLKRLGDLVAAALMRAVASEA